MFERFTEITFRQYVYQAYTSGVSPPGPGKMSFSSLSTSSSRLISTALIASRSCSTVLGPIIGAVSAGFVSTHANATLASFSPSSLHKAENLSSCVRCFSIKSALWDVRVPACFLAHGLREALLQAGSMPLRQGRDPGQPAALPFPPSALINYTYAAL